MGRGTRKLAFSESDRSEYEIDAQIEELEKDPWIIPGSWADMCTVSFGEDEFPILDSLEEAFEYLINQGYIVESKRALSHCYRMGFDAMTGLLTAVEFELIPEKINYVGDKRMTDKVKEFNQYLRNANSQQEVDKLINEMHDKALIDVRKSVRRFGHIDFRTDALPVTHIFSPNGKARNECQLYGIFSPTVHGFIKYLKKHEDLIGIKSSRSRLNFLKSDKVAQWFKKYIQMNPGQSEHYMVNTSGGARKYKSTKIFWDMDLFNEYQFSPKVRGRLNHRSLGERQKSQVRYNANNKPEKLTPDEAKGYDEIERLQAEKNKKIKEMRQYPDGSPEQYKTLGQAQELHAKAIKKNDEMRKKMVDPKMKKGK